MPDWLPEALGFPSRSGEAVASRLAQLGGLREPTRPETKDLLVSVLVRATSRIPDFPAAWSWVEWYHAGTAPLDEMTRNNEYIPIAICAEDLGVAERPSPPAPWDDGPVSPRLQLLRNLTDAVERLLHELEQILKAAGIDDHGWMGRPGEVD